VAPRTPKRPNESGARPIAGRARTVGFEMDDSGEIKAERGRLLWAVRIAGQRPLASF